jgi:hypothetical protein
MAATDVKIVGICIESRHASNGTRPDIPNPKNTFFTNLDAPHSYIFSNDRPSSGCSDSDGSHIFVVIIGGLPCAAAVVSGGQARATCIASS